jgi:glycosyltransferase involved in cell wall biosynthesis
VHVVVPPGLDDPRRPSGGNVYDRRLCAGLEAAGWTVHEHPVPSTRGALAARLADLPPDATVLVDGLVPGACPDELLPHAGRLRLVVLLHLPLGVASNDPAVRAGEAEVLGAARAVVTTSGWARLRLLERYPLPVERVHVAEPGADVATTAAGTGTGGRLLCVAALTPAKGHPVLLAALAEVRDLPWTCDCVGSVDRDPGHTRRLCDLSSDLGLTERVRFTGARTGPALDASYAAADVLVHASRFESFGMVVTEALAHGLPVVATAVGAVPETLGSLPDGTRPGLLVRPDDPAALADALRRWLSDASLRAHLRAVAGKRRADLPGWERTVERVGRVLSEVAAA